MKIKETEAAIEAILFAMGGSVELPRIPDHRTGKFLSDVYQKRIL